MAVSAASEDWLDTSCWRCGSEQIVPARDGRLLCGPCRHELFDSTGSGETPLGAVRRLYWEAHALERCWRCMDRPVDPADDLGICSNCR